MQNDNVIKVFCNFFHSALCSTYFFPLYFLFNVFCFLLKKTNIVRVYIYYKMMKKTVVFVYQKDSENLQILKIPSNYVPTSMK